MRERDGESEEGYLAKRDAQRLDFGDQQRGEEGAGNTAHAADNDDDKRVTDRGDVLTKIGRLARQVQRAAERRKPRAQRKHPGKKHRLIDAERGDHVAVLCRGADENAPARARQKQPEQPENSRSDKDQRKVICRKRAAENEDCALQARRARSDEIFRSPELQYDVLHDQRKRKCREQLKQFRRAIDAAQQQNLDERADDRDGNAGEKHRGPVAHTRATNPRDQ